MKNVRWQGLWSLAVLLLVLVPLGSVAATGDSNSKDGCTISDRDFPVLSLNAQDTTQYAEATFEFDKNCNPVLVSEQRLNYLPANVTTPGAQDQEPYKTVTTGASGTDTGEESVTGILAPTAVNTCHMRSWEEDVVGLYVIHVQSDQTYYWDWTRVSLHQGNTSATTWFSWWFLSSGPTKAYGQYNTQTGFHNGDAGFYCNGGPFCGGGAMYHITIKNRMTVSHSGACSGYGTFSGTIIPAGRFKYAIWRD